MRGGLPEGDPDQQHREDEPGVLQGHAAERRLTTRGASSAFHFGALVALVSCGAAISLHYGRLGFMPLDQSIIFDAGWRVTSGQWPYADFMTPDGLVPTLMQGALFRVLGVTWFVYCLHAAILNGLFGALVLAILRELGLDPARAWFFGLLSTVVFYPPFGVPYPDQHSFFFAACCLFVTVGTIRGRPWWWLASAPVFGALAGLSKPIPAIFLVAPCAAVLLSVCAQRGAPAWRALGLGLGIVAASTAAYLVLVRVHVREAAYYALELPRETMGTRGGLGDVWKAWAGLRPLVVWRGLVIHLVGALVLLSGRAPRAIRLWVLAEGLLLVCAAYVVITNNEAVNGAAYLFLAAGIAALAADLAFGQPGLLGRFAPLVRPLVALAIVALCGLSAWRFDRHVNATRIVHDQYFDAGARRWSPGGALGFMRLNDAWRVTDPRPILAYIAERPDNFLLVGDASVLYGATRHPSVPPILWFHPGLTMPNVGTPEFTALEQALDARMRAFDVRYVIVEGRSTLMGVTAEMLEPVRRRTEGCKAASLGAWTIENVCR